MSKQIATSTEAVELLRIFLNEDLVKQQTLASNLHAKKSGLSNVGFRLDMLATDLKNKKKIIPEDLTNLKAMLDDAVEQLRPIHSAMFPSMVYLIGIFPSLRQYVNHYKDDFGIKIEFTYQDMEGLPTDKFTQVYIYKVCTEIIEKLRLLGNRKISVSFIVKKNKLRVVLTGINTHKRKRKFMQLDKRVGLIKALLIWKKVKVLPETDWNSLFSLEFTL